MHQYWITLTTPLTKLSLGKSNNNLVRCKTSLSTLNAFKYTIENFEIYGKMC